MKFSIIIPTHNRCELLKRAVISVLDQSYENFEIIVVDDGGSDDSKKMLDEISDSRIRYYWKQNEERSIARNFGICKAKGDYINFLDSDDYQLSNHLEAAWNMISTTNFQEVYHMSYKIKTNDGKDLLTRNQWNAMTAEHLCSENTMHGNAIFIKKEIAIKNQFVNSRYAIFAEDWYLWLKLFLKFRIIFSETITSVVVEHSHRSLNHINPEALEINVKTLISSIKKEDYWNTYKNRLYIYCSRQYAFLSLTMSDKFGLKRKSIIYLLTAIRYNGGFVFSRQFFAILRNVFLRKSQSNTVQSG